MMKWHTHSLSKSTQTHTTCCLKIELIREGIPLTDIWTWPSTTSLTCVMWQVKIRPERSPHHFKNLSSSSHPSSFFLCFFPNHYTKLTSFLHPDYEDLLDCNCGLCALLLRPFFLVHGKFARKRKQHETRAVLDSSCGVCVEMPRLEASVSYVSHHILTSWTQAEANAILPQV